MARSGQAHDGGRGSAAASGAAQQISALQAARHGAAQIIIVVFNKAGAAEWACPEE